jgi:hypothetical protein
MDVPGNHRLGVRRIRRVWIPGQGARSVALCSDPPVLLPRITRCAWSSRDNGTASERMPGWGSFVRGAGVRLGAWVCAS